MYKPNDWTWRQWRKVVNTLRLPHTYSVTAKLLDLDGKHVMDLPAINGDDPGQIDQAGGARHCKLDLNDPGGLMSSYEGEAGAAYLTRIFYNILTPDFNDDGKDVWATTPLITACIGADGTGITRSDTQVTIVGRDKLYLAQWSPEEPYTVPKGTKVTTAIIRLLMQAGERRNNIDIPDRPLTLKKDFTVGIEEFWWNRAADLAAQLDLLMFYRAGGTVIAKPYPKASSWTLETGFHARPGFLTTQPIVGPSFSGFHNRVVILYDTKLDKHWVEEPDPSHPLSKQTLKRNGINRPETLILKRPHEKDLSNVKAEARIVLHRELKDVVTAQGECYPFPFMEQGDIYKIGAHNYAGPTTIPNWTLPFQQGVAQTIGWNDVRSGW